MAVRSLAARREAPPGFMPSLKFVRLSTKKLGGRGVELD
jgi:hypothetical protein